MVIVVIADSGLRGLQEFKTRQFCSSGASLSIRLTSGGSCSGVASASCSVGIEI